MYKQNSGQDNINDRKRNNYGCNDNDKEKYYNTPRDFKYKKKTPIWKKLLITFAVLILIIIIFLPKFVNINSTSPTKTDDISAKNTKKDFNPGVPYDTDNFTLMILNPRVLTDTYGKSYKVIDIEVNVKKNANLKFKASGITENHDIVDSNIEVPGHNDLKVLPSLEKLTSGDKIKGQGMFEIKDGKDIKKLWIVENGNDIFYNI